VCDEVGAYFMVDMAHFAGLVAGGAHDNPLDYADVVTTTTHKTLRGPRGGMILSNNEELGKKFNSAIFPGIQGGPLMHVIAAKAVAFGEALQPSFKTYAHNVVANADILAKTIKAGGYDLVSGGTDTHVVLVDLRPKGLTGRDAESALERVGLTCNKNGVPFDPAPPTVTSGIRLGSPAGTTRGLGLDEFKWIGEKIVEVLDGLVKSPQGDSNIEEKVRKEVLQLCKRFPIY
ncbi:MAG: serine hydroxymethyltransferase, partial [Pseudomonadota bacterium]